MSKVEVLLLFFFSFSFSFLETKSRHQQLVFPAVEYNIQHSIIRNTVWNSASYERLVQ